jgi:quercetin dioxygenase-like cupin family protein
METSGESAASVGSSRDPNSSGPGGVRIFDLGREALNLTLAVAPERNARTIARLETLRLTLMKLEAGSCVMQHKSQHQISIQTVSGHVVLHTPAALADLPAGRIAVLERSAMHDIEALADSTILITVCISAPPAAARMQPDRGGQLALDVWSDEGGASSTQRKGTAHGTR